MIDMVGVNIQGTVSQETMDSIDGLINEGLFPSRAAALRDIVTSYFLKHEDSDEVARLTAEVQSLKAQLEAARSKGNDRVLVLLDVQNVCHELRRLGLFIDYSILRTSAVAGRHSVGTIAFDGRHYSAEKDTTKAFHDILAQCGWALDLRDLHDETHQKEVDVSLATTLISGAVRDSYDTAVIISGDRDFVPAIEYVRSMGRRVEVMSFESSLSTQLSKVADTVTLLDSAFIVSLSSDCSEAEA